MDLKELQAEFLKSQTPIDTKRVPRYPHNKPINEWSMQEQNKFFKENGVELFKYLVNTKQTLEELGFEYFDTFNIYEGGYMIKQDNH